MTKRSYNLTNKRKTSVTLHPITLTQIAELAAATGLNQTSVIQTAVDRMYREEIRQDTQPEETK